MLPGLETPLGALQWGALLLVPPAIVLLYFLKLKRTPLEVPSTYLWHKSIEDLHVNTIWQRLRQSLLLFLQLLLVALLMLALLGPYWRGAELTGDKFIFLVDVSASMAASDVAPTRLAEAKRRVAELIDQMRSGDEAMLISFSDAARVEQSFTDNRKRLRTQLDGIQQTQRPTAILEALRVAAGLVNPTKSEENAVAPDERPKLYIFSDGNFAPAADFKTGNLDPIYQPIGTPEAANVAIAAFSTRRSEDRPDKLQAFARLENHGPEEAVVQAELRLDGNLLDASEAVIPPGDSQGVVFELEQLDEGVLELVVTPADALSLDDRAWAPINAPRRAKVLFITPGNDPLRFALITGRASSLAEVTIVGPSYLQDPEYQTLAAAGAYDLIIYDRCQPPAAAPDQPAAMPQSNTLFIGALPPVAGWGAEPSVNVPQIIDTERGHPLMQLLELGDVLIAEGTPLAAPPGGQTLIDSTSGALLAISPRDGFEDVALGFVLVGPGNTVGSNWHVRLSFPVFVLNALTYLGGSLEAASGGLLLPGQPVLLRSEIPAESLTISTPDGRRAEVRRGKFGGFQFSGAEVVGVYDVLRDEERIERFAVNLFDNQESRLPPAPEVTLGNVQAEVQQGARITRRDAWKIVALIALGVLLLEWYIYNRRVYI